MSMIKFNGLNFTEWSEQIQFHLGVLNLDLALVNEKPAALTANSSADERSFHDAWERSNRLSLMFMRMTIASNIKATIPNTENAREFLKFVENISKSESADKSRAGTLMAMLTTIKFDGSRSMHEHVTEMINTAAKLKSMGMEVGEKFLVQFIINSLPSEYGPFQMSYNTIKDEWSVNELHSMLIQEETRLKKQGIHSVNLLGQKGAIKKPIKKKNKGVQKSHNVNGASNSIQKKEPKGVKCHFCKKLGHFQKDCQKRKAWFEKKGKPSAFVCFESNLAEVPSNTW